MKHILVKSFVVCLLALVAVCDLQARQVRVACIGDSITASVSRSDPSVKGVYPNRLQELLGNDYLVQNFGVGGTTGWFGNPWWREKTTTMLTDVLSFRPDVIIWMFGVNDANYMASEALNYTKYPWLEGLTDDIIVGKLVNNLKNKPRVIVAKPSYVYGTVAGNLYSTDWKTCETRIRDWLLPYADDYKARLEAKLGMTVPMTDIYTLTYNNRDSWYTKAAGSDGIHPIDAGYQAIAAAFATEVQGLGLDPATLPELAPEPDFSTPHVYYVDPAAKGTGDGLGWANAFTDIQRAIEVAHAQDEIRIKGGTYVLTAPVKVYGKNNLTITGGFDGETILKQTTAGCRPVEVFFSDNVTVSKVTLTGGTPVGDRVDLTLKGGATTGAMKRQANGGGLAALSSTGITLDTVTFRCNRVTHEGNWTTAGGGGAYLDAESTVTGCLFEDNAVDVNGASANWATAAGGGLHIAAGTVSRSTFKRNRLVGAGGGENIGSALGAGLYSAGALSVDECLFLLNSACCAERTTNRYAGYGDGLAGNALKITQSTIAFNGREGVRFLAGGSINDSIVYGNGRDIVANPGVSPIVYYTMQGEAVDPLLLPDGGLAAGSPALTASLSSARIGCTWTPVGGARPCCTVGAGGEFATVSAALASVSDCTDLKLTPGVLAGETYPIVVKDRYGIRFICEDANPCVLDNGGAAGANVFTLTNSCGIVMSNVTVRGGCATDTKAGGIQMIGANLWMFDSSVIGNTNRCDKDNADLYGAGISVLGSHAALRRVTFRDNCFVQGKVKNGYPHGGAVAVVWGGLDAVSCDFEDNGTDPNSSFRANDAYHDYNSGGAVFASPAHLRLANCRFAGNSVTAKESVGRSSAVMAASGTAPGYGSSVLENCTFDANQSAAVETYLASADVFLTGCVFKNTVGGSAVPGSVGSIAVSNTWADVTSTAYADGVNDCVVSPDGSAPIGTRGAAAAYDQNFPLTVVPEFPTAYEPEEPEPPAPPATTVTCTTLAAFADALASANSGDVIELVAGVYDVQTPLALTGKTGVTVRGAANGKTVLTTTREGDQAAVLTVTDCTDCTVGWLYFRDCAHISTTGRVFGGALDVERCTRIAIQSCDFRSCFGFCASSAAENGAFGGAIGLYNCTDALVDHCRVVGCEVQSTMSYGTDNYHGCGGGVAFYQSSGSVSSCHIVGNAATSPGVSTSIKGLDEGGPGGVFVYSTNPDNKPDQAPRVAVSNCLFAANACFSGMMGATFRRHGVDVFELPDLTTVNSDEQRCGGLGAGLRGRAMDVSRCTFAWNNGSATFFMDEADSNAKRSNNTHNGNQYWENRYSFGRNNTRGTFVDAGTVEDKDPRFERDGRPLGKIAGCGYRPEATWQGQDLWVDMTKGDDANAGTASAPLKSITAALAKAVDGAVITVASGRYTVETETFPLDLNARIGLTLQGAGAESTVIDATGAANVSVLSIGGSAFVTVRGLTVRGARLDALAQNGIRYGAGARVRFAGDVAFEQCVFTDNEINAKYDGSVNFGLGIGCFGACGRIADCVFTNLTAAAGGVSSKCYGGVIGAFKGVLDIDRCRILDNISAGGSSGGGGRCYGAVGLFGFWDGDDSHVRNTLIARNRMDGGRDADQNNQYRANGMTMMRGTIVNCTIVSNVNYSAKGALTWGDGVYRWPANSGVVEADNTVVCGHYRYDFDGGVTGDYNAFAKGTVAGGTHNIALAATDWPFSGRRREPFSIRGSSVLCDAGGDVGWTKADVDLIGKPRLVGNAVDIGCFEWKPFGLLIVVR